MDGPDSHALFNEAIGLQQQGDLDGALRLYHAILAAEPGNRAAWSNLRTVLQKGGRGDEIIRLIRARWPSLEDFGAHDDGPSDEAPRELARNADAAAIHAGLDRHGVVMIRNIVSRGLLSMIDSGFSRLAVDMLRGDSALDDETLSLFVPPAVTKTMTALGLALDPGLCYFRKVTPDKDFTSVPFHQDIMALGHLCANIWVPLDRCGLDAPGLEILPRRVKRLVEAGGDSHASYRATEITPATVATVAEGTALWRPILEPGDLLLFLGSTIHRTYISPDMTRPRTSLEVRFS